MLGLLLCQDGPAESSLVCALLPMGLSAVMLQLLSPQFWRDESLTAQLVAFCWHQEGQCTCAYFPSPCPFLCSCSESGLSGCCQGEFLLLHCPGYGPVRGESSHGHQPLAPPAAWLLLCQGCGGVLHRDLSGISQEGESSGWVLDSGVQVLHKPLPSIWVLRVLQPWACIAWLHPGAIASRGTGCGRSVLSCSAGPKAL